MARQIVAGIHSEIYHSSTWLQCHSGLHPWSAVLWVAVLAVGPSKSSTEARHADPGVSGCPLRLLWDRAPEVFPSAPLGASSHRALRPEVPCCLTQGLSLVARQIVAGIQSGIYHSSTSSQCYSGLHVWSVVLWVAVLALCPPSHPSRPSSLTPVSLVALCALCACCGIVHRRCSSPQCTFGGQY